MSDFEFSPDQARAIDAILEWWRDERGSQTFALAGYAGTGKTTILHHLLEVLDEEHVSVAAPTGKAAMRLREKGVHATTVHQLAYKFEGLDEDGKPEFEYRGLGRNDLVIVDEASMVNSAMYRDLTDGKCRLLFVGDHGQLPPIGGDPGLMRDPDFALEMIHRQDDSGLLDFAHALREGTWLPEASGAARTLWIDPRRGNAAAEEVVGSADVLICWRNVTRHWLNRLAMKVAGLPHLGAPVPLLGDLRGNTVRAVCLRNDYRNRLFNGELVDLTIGELTDRSLRATVQADVGPPRKVLVDASGFCAERTPEPAPGHALFDFGYALTAHKAQGSEWPRVAVYDDTHRRMEDRSRWAYTAATRPQEELLWLHP